MNKMEFSAIEKEMASFNFNDLQTQAQTAKAGIATAESVEDIKDKICQIWSKIGKYVKLAENIPFIGKFVTILADLLDSICAAG